MKRIYKNYRLSITPLTCLSVTNGEKVTNHDYIVSGGCCNVFDSDKVVAKIFSDSRYRMKRRNLEHCEDISVVSEILKEVIEPEDVVYKVMCSKAFAEEKKGNLEFYPIYKEKVHDKLYPVIPGSSIKGAVRTALLSDCYKNNNFRNIEELESAFYLERYCLDQEKVQVANKSVMKAFKFSDAFAAEEENPKIVLVKTKILPQTKKGKSSFSPSIEVLPGKIMTDNYDSYVSTVSIEEVPDSDKFGLYCSTENIADICNAFSERTLTEELRIDRPMHGICESNFGLSEKIEKIKTEIEQAKKIPGTFVIKIGRFSQVEYMTISEELRRVPVPRRSKKNPDKFGHSRTLAYDGNSYFPMGWCLCSFSE